MDEREEDKERQISQFVLDVCAIFLFGSFLGVVASLGPVGDCFGSFFPIAPRFLVQ